MECVDGNEVAVISLPESMGSYSMQMMGDQEKEETFSSPVITICSDFILP